MVKPHLRLHAPNEYTSPAGWTVELLNREDLGIEISSIKTVGPVPSSRYALLCAQYQWWPLQ